MPMVDIALLSKRKVALIDEAGGVEIAYVGDETALSASESRQLQLFLQRQELRLLACSGGTPLHRHVKVWRPQEAWLALPRAYLNCRAGIEAHVGYLAPYASFEEGHWCYAGISLDQRVVVIVPGALLTLRRRELLMKYVREISPQTPLNCIALAQVVAQAEQQMQRDPDAALNVGEMEVAWWLDFAGPEPTGHDQRDARRKES